MKEQDEKKIELLVLENQVLREELARVYERLINLYRNKKLDDLEEVKSA